MRDIIMRDTTVDQLRKKLQDLNSDPRIKRDPRGFVIEDLPYCGPGPDAHCDAPDAECDAPDADDDAPNVR